jgi:hypothetical protein
MSATHSEVSTKDLPYWGEPLIADYIFAAFGRHFAGDQVKSDSLARQHCRMWRNLLHGQTSIAAFQRRELIKAAERLNLDPSEIDAIDMGVFEYLLDAVMRRGARAGSAARQDGMTLVTAASRLGEIRQVA